MRADFDLSNVAPDACCSSTLASLVFTTLLAFAHNRFIDFLLLCSRYDNSEDMLLQAVATTPHISVYF